MTDKPLSPRGRRTRLMSVWFSPEEAEEIEAAAEAWDVSYSNILRNGGLREARERLAARREGVS